MQPGFCQRGKFLLNPADRAASARTGRAHAPMVFRDRGEPGSAAEMARERAKQLAALRPPPSAVESKISRLDHHGLNRCLDAGMQGCLRHVGGGMVSCNMPWPHFSQK
jgi:hypothetical protein